MLSKTAKYGLRAVTYLAERHRSDGGWVRIDEIAEELELPRNYLSKVLHLLGRAGVLASVRGPGGGFRLAREPDQITLAQVIGVLDEWQEGETPCLLRAGPCTPDTPCVAHHRWRAIADETRAFLIETSLEELLAGADHAALRF